MSSTPAYIKAVCAMAFAAFAFCWLFFFQADAMAVAQHVLSGGVTTYNRTAGAVIITLALLAVQTLVAAVARLPHKLHALSFLPSMLTLAWLTDITPEIGHGQTAMPWPWLAPLASALFVAAVVLLRKYTPMASEGDTGEGLLTRAMWVNLLQMVAMATLVALLAGTNAVFHYRARAEAALLRGDNATALAAGEHSLETDASLTLLRAFALSRQGMMGERLFHYTIRGKGCDLLPLPGSNSRLLMLPDTLLWDYLGLRPDSAMGFTAYIDSIERRSALADSLSTALATATASTGNDAAADTTANNQANDRAWRDYSLAALLIDRQLDVFASELPRHYAMHTDSLPTHYREALALYASLAGTALLDDTATTARWRDFKAKGALYPTPTERQIRTEADYSHTYWHYYFFCHK